VKELKGLGGVNNVAVDASLDSHAAGKWSRENGAIDYLKRLHSRRSAFSAVRFHIKTSPPSPFSPNVADSLPQKLNFTPTGPSVEWDKGVTYAPAQNLARTVRSFRSLHEANKRTVISSPNFLRI